MKPGKTFPKFNNYLKLFKEAYMAVKDVRQYFFTMLNQYLEEKNNLADFQEALKEGLITEDQMSEVMEIVAGLEANYHRLVYIMYLLDMPEKKAAYVR